MEKKNASDEENLFLPTFDIRYLHSVDLNNRPVTEVYAAIAGWEERKAPDRLLGEQALLAALKGLWVSAIADCG